MFRNLSFRGRLTLVLAPPLAALVAFAALLALPRLGLRDEAAQNEVEARVARASMQLLDEFQNERDLTFRRVSHPDLVSIDEMVSQREVTDGRVVEFVDVARRATGGESQTALVVQAAVASAESLADVRDRVDGGRVNAADVYAFYTDGVDSFLDVNEALAVDSSNTDLVRIATSILSYTRAKEQVAQLRGTVTIHLDDATFNPADYAAANASATAAVENFSTFLTSATDSNRQLFAELDGQPGTIDALSQLNELLAAGFSGIEPAITGDEWFEAWNLRMEELDVVEDVLFDEFVAETGKIQDAEQRSAYTFVAVSAIATLLAAASAFLLARSMTRRLANLSHQAQEIATVRLPEVLDALRNPSPEALAGALPEVVSDSTDEIGIMAQSFNAVLRTSVETSIGHAQRRAQTLTNILVNLGRRNQSLIERQLRLIDELEATEKDPKLLAGLFQLDHLITSMRRNAENLLVLASEQPGRAWTAPVPVLDVIRSASSEVQDMARLVIEVAPRDNVDVAGRFAVDLSHLLAELIDNAIAYSPPQTAVHIRSEGGPGQLRIWIIDNGVGISPVELQLANERVAHPPDIDELSADQIGFQVVGRLARRLGVAVQLQANPGGGLAICVSIPMQVLHSGSVLDEPPALNVDGERADDNWPHSVVEATSVGLPERTALPEAGPPPPPMPSRVSPATVQPQAAGPAPSPMERADVTSAPDAAAAWHEPSTTMAGLAKRVPGQAYSGHAAAEAFDAGHFRRLPTPDAAAGDDNDVAVRRLDSLSRFQRALDRGRSEDDTSTGSVGEPPNSAPPVVEAAHEPEVDAWLTRTPPPARNALLHASPMTTPQPLDAAPRVDPPMGGSAVESQPSSPDIWTAPVSDTNVAALDPWRDVASAVPQAQVPVWNEPPVPQAQVPVWNEPAERAADSFNAPEPDLAWIAAPAPQSIWPEPPQAPAQTEVDPGTPGQPAAVASAPEEVDPFDISWILADKQTTTEKERGW